MKALFKKILTGDPIINEHIAMVTGQKWHIRPYYWQNQQTNEEYNYITGGIVWPTLDSDGYAFTIGVQADETLAFQCLDEIETGDSVELFKWCVDLQKRYGCKNDTTLFPYWYGDPERLMSLTSENNIKEDVRNNRLVITPPPDFTEKDAFQTYFSRLAVSIMPGTKTLWVNDCQTISNNLTEFSMGGGVDKANPVINCVGWTVHALLSYEPWKSSVKKKRLGGNNFESRAMKQHENFEQRMEMMRWK